MFGVRNGCWRCPWDERGHPPPYFFTQRFHMLAYYFSHFLQIVSLIYHIARSVGEMFTSSLLIAAICSNVQTYYRAPPHLTIHKLPKFSNRHSHSVCLSFPWQRVSSFFCLNPSMQIFFLISNLFYKSFKNKNNQKVRQY